MKIIYDERPEVPSTVLLNVTPCRFVNNPIPRFIDVMFSAKTVRIRKIRKARSTAARRWVHWPMFPPDLF